MIIQQERGNNRTHLIKQFYIEELFCTYTYKLSIPKTNSNSPQNLMLLYGNNGAGKTTILNIIYHLLNPEPFDGHRTFIGNIPFKKIEILLDTGYKICAVRKEADSRKYKYILIDENNQKIIQWNWLPEKTKRASAKEDVDYRNLCERLGELNLKFHYLRDTRRVEGIDNTRRIFRSRVSNRDFLQHEKYKYIIDSSEAEEDQLSPNEILNLSIARAVDWFRDQALSGTNIGSTSVNSIYEDLINNIVTQGKSLNDEQGTSIDDLANKLVSLNNRNTEFARYGLTPKLDIAEITKNLCSADTSHTDLLNTVLSPYLAGHKARLDALEEVQKVMSNFTSLLGEFYSEKKVNIHLHKGLRIASKRGIDLSPTVLSSGEKQLLLLLCHAISARQSGTIFVIDEPEISLNVKWQRKLIPALITCLSGTESQIILATHSIELLSQYKNYVTPLTNLTESA